jgi:streptomycin 6-kinase
VHAHSGVPPALRWLEDSPEGREWLHELPRRVQECGERWRLALDAPYPNSFVSIVYPATRHDGSRVVLKIQYPHHESDHEHEALRLWNGEGAVHLFEYNAEHHALLLERCETGEPLTTAGADEALRVYSSLLPRLWVTAGIPFTSLADEAAGWIASLPTRWEHAGRPVAIGLLDLALESLERLRTTQGPQVLVHQDLHAGNILRATREPWLVIDPKPIAGEREFSLAPIVRGAELGHTRADVVRRLDTLASTLGVDRERARLWTLGQALAWGCGRERVADFLETARWLSEA